MSPYYVEVQQGSHKTVIVAKISNRDKLSNTCDITILDIGPIHTRNSIQPCRGCIIGQYKCSKLPLGYQLTRLTCGDYVRVISGLTRLIDCQTHAIYDYCKANNLTIVSIIK